MRCQFDGSLDVRRGEIVKITTAISDTDPLRVSVIENVTSGKRQVSRIEGVMMVKPPVKLTEPIFGRVKSSQVDQYNTYFEIEEISPKDTESKEEHRDLQLAQDIQVYVMRKKIVRRP